MKLLEAQPEIAPGAPPEPPHETPEQAQPEPGAHTCTSCGAQMEPGQDWCLACGAASGPLEARPGARPAMAVLGLVLLLVAGAVGASYAALRDDQTVPPTQTAAQVAQTPPPAQTTPPPPATATTPPATTTPPASTSTGKSTLPKVQVPATTAPKVTPTPAPAPVPAAPRTTSPPAASTPPATTPPATSTPSTTTPGSTTTTPGSTTTTPAAPTPIDIPAANAAVYDPYRRATAVGVPAKAVDGDGSTSWFIDTPAGQPSVNAGFVVNVGSARGIRSLDITTPTPGFKVEIYATDEPTAPPAITDTRWAHITDKSDVGTDGKTHVVLGAGSSKYQTLLLWITKPPSEGTRVRISELKVFG
jgi:hypothetical protein